MTLYISAERVVSALDEIKIWRSRVNSQMAVHLWLFLSVKKNDVSTEKWTFHPEQKDFDFCDSALQVCSGSKPYFDPIANDFRIASHPHSNIATSRKNTLKNRWQAALTNPEDQEQWKFAANYVDVLEKKMCTLKNKITKVPLNSLCAWLYRDREFIDGTTVSTLRKTFRDDYHITDDEYQKLFQDSLDDSQIELDTKFFSASKSDSKQLLEILKNRAPESSATDQAGTTTPQQRNVTASNPSDGLNPELLARLLTEGRGQVVLYGPPGTGKTFISKLAIAQILDIEPSEVAKHQIDPAAVNIDSLESHISQKGGWALIQFHPSYCYEDFVRGISTQVNGSGAPTFEVKDRTFAKLCRLASKTKGQVVLIIDEINRGDLSKVLGELIYALEYRNEPVSAQYATKEGSTLVVPDNLLLLATMNTSDKSISHIDYAIRRRFDFVPCMPDRRVINLFHEGSIFLKPILALFDGVTSLVGENKDFAIGHSYFLENSADKLARAFVFQVLPILFEYRNEGLVSSNSISVEGWRSGTIALTTAMPFVLAEEIAEWIGQGGEE